MAKPVRTMGADISLNHGAIVCLDNGKPVDLRYYTSVVGSANRSKLGTRLPKPHSDRHQGGVERLAWVAGWFRRTLERARPQYVNIEDYALDSDHGQAYQGEVGGACRLVCWEMGIKLRLTDPTTNKMCVALNGKAKKDVFEAAVKNRFGVDFGHFNLLPTGRGKPNRQTSEDLADAFGLAYILWLEVQLRAGQIRLSSLHAKEIQAFNRLTKAQPTGLLDRPWIAKEQDQ